LWFNQGSTIGCPVLTGNSGNPTDGPDCKNHAQPTIKFGDKDLRTYALNPIYALDDYTKWHPWRYPGSGPVLDPCGIAGGWFTPGADFAGGWAPPGVAQGELGSFAPFNSTLSLKTRWVAGTQAEVAWGITANHGGGYQYRICKNDGGDRNETCFQKTPLRFVGDTQWIQFGHGMDRNNRTEIPATTVTGDKVLPVNSTWRKNPIPPCNFPITGGAVVTPCPGPTFTPPIPGLYGFGPGGCGSEVSTCTIEQFRKRNFDFGIVDKIEVPDVEGEYIISFRWESEQTNQIWMSCADVTIVKASEGPATKPFTLTDGCDACCEGKFAICANCTKCQNDKTGDCAYCWNVLPGYNPTYAPSIHCLGKEAPDGGPPEWYPGEDTSAGWSPGCPKCWRTNPTCEPVMRPLEDVPVSV